MGWNRNDGALRQSTRITLISRIRGAIDISSGYTSGEDLAPTGSWAVTTLVEAAQVEQTKGWMSSTQLNSVQFVGHSKTGAVNCGPLCFRVCTGTTVLPSAPHLVG